MRLRVLLGTFIVGLLINSGYALSSETLPSDTPSEEAPVSQFATWFKNRSTQQPEPTTSRFSFNVPLSDRTKNRIKQMAGLYLISDVLLLGEFGLPCTLIIEADRKLRNLETICTNNGGKYFILLSVASGLSYIHATLEALMYEHCTPPSFKRNDFLGNMFMNTTIRVSLWAVLSTLWIRHTEQWFKDPAPAPITEPTTTDPQKA